MKDDRLYLHHILERCRRITRFIEPGREAFMASDQLQDAVIRNVEVIGEAAKRVSAEVRGRRGCSVLQFFGSSVPLWEASVLWEPKNRITEEPLTHRLRSNL